MTLPTRPIPRFWLINVKPKWLGPFATLAELASAFARLRAEARWSTPRLVDDQAALAATSGNYMIDRSVWLAVEAHEGARGSLTLEPIASSRVLGALPPPAAVRVGRRNLPDFRCGPMPHIHRIGGYRRFRRPRTTAERRWGQAYGPADLADDLDEFDGVDLAVCRFRDRPHRRARALPSSWDDLPRAGAKRSWKALRRHQWRVRSRPAVDREGTHA